MIKYFLNMPCLIWGDFIASYMKYVRIPARFSELKRKIQCEVWLYLRVLLWHILKRISPNGLSPCICLVHRSLKKVVLSVKANMRNVFSFFSVYVTLWIKSSETVQNNILLASSNTWNNWRKTESTAEFLWRLHRWFRKCNMALDG